MFLWVFCAFGQEKPIHSDWEFEQYTRPLSDRAPFISAKVCANCHKDIYKQWKESRHALSWSNELFTEGYILEPDPICVYCHAPHREQAQEIERNEEWVRSMHPDRGSLTEHPPRYPEPMASEGITCATCHVREGKVIAAQERSLAGHPIQVDERLSQSIFCKDCHDFPVIERHNGRLIISETAMQTTYQEWLLWSQQGNAQQCQDCHMSEGKHDWHGANNRELLQASVSIDVHRDGSEVVFTLQSVGVGHHMPTGDLFRHMRIEIKRDGEWAEVAYIGRKFASQWEGDRPYKRLVYDNALRPEVPQEFRISEHRSLPWRLVYYYTSQKDIFRATLPTSVTTEILDQGSIPQ